MKDYWRLRPCAPRDGTRLGPLAELAEDDAREYVFGCGPSAFRMFVVRHAGALHAYLNLCPHASLPLNCGENAFLAPDRQSLICRRHYAQFDISEGICVAGACVGSRLDRIPLHLDADNCLRIGQSHGEPAAAHFVQQSGRIVQAIEDSDPRP